MSHTDKITIVNNFLKYDELELKLYENTKNGSEELSEEKPIHGSVIYGHNGSGKSSIARALSDYRSNHKNEQNYAILNNRNLNENNSDFMFVYDQNFIDSKIKFASQDVVDSSLKQEAIQPDLSNNESKVENDKDLASEGFQAIVMVENQDEINKNLKNIHAKIKETETKKDSLNKKLDKSKNKSNKTSPEFWLERIKETLKEDKVGWAEIDGKIKKNKVKSKVNISTIEKLIKSNSDTEELSYDILESYINTLNKIENEQKIEKLDLKHNIFDGFEKQFVSILQETIKKPQFNEETNRVIEILTNEGNSFLCNSAELLDKGYKYCPTCLRDLSNPEEVRKQILEVLKKQEETDLEIKIKQFKIPEIQDLPSDYKQFANFRTYEKCKEKYIQVQQSYKKDLDEKTDNLYQSMNKTSSISLLNLQESINTIISDLNKEIEIHNKKFDEKNIITEKAFKINDEIAKNKIKLDYNQYIKSKNVKEENNKRLKSLDNTYRRLKELEEQAMQDFKNTKLGLEDINKNLSIIYMYDSNIKVVEKNGLYKVEVDGRSVPLDKLSTGQKNAITLAYFFSTIHNGYSIEDKYKNEIVIVLDDPISSFDYNNRIGIFSFLRYQFHNIIKGSNQSKIILLTHDSGVAYNMCKIFDDVEEQRKRGKQSSNIKVRHKLYQLSNVPADNHFIRTQPEESLYTSMLQDIYLFASNELNEDTYTISIGNNMRRVLEGFATFSYKEGITGISNDSEILDLIENEKEREFYKSFMYRFLLHGESHSEEIANHALESNINKLDMGSKDKRKIAQRFIYFIYALNPLHVVKHLDGKNSKCKDIFEEETIKSWKPVVNDS